MATSKPPLSQLWANLAAKLDQPPSNTCYGIALAMRKCGNAVMLIFTWLAVEIGPDESAGDEDVPAGLYGRFHCPGPFATRQLILDYIIHTWLPQSNLILAHPFVLEHYQNCPDDRKPITLGDVCASSERIITKSTGSCPTQPYPTQVRYGLKSTQTML